MKDFLSMEKAVVKTNKQNKNTTAPEALTTMSLAQIISAVDDPEGGSQLRRVVPSLPQGLLVSRQNPSPLHSHSDVMHN